MREALLAQIDAAREQCSAMASQLDAYGAQLYALRATVELYFQPAPSTECPPHPESELMDIGVMGSPSRKQCRRCKEIINE